MTFARPNPAPIPAVPTETSGQVTLGLFRVAIKKFQTQDIAGCDGAAKSQFVTSLYRLADTLSPTVNNSQTTRLLNLSKIMLDDVLAETDEAKRIEIIRNYEDKCKETTLGEKLKTVIAGVIFGAIGVVMGVAIGAAVGMYLGIWAGPGAFVAAALAAVKGAVTGATLAVGAAGLGTGIVTGTAAGLFSSRKTREVKATMKVAEDAIEAFKSPAPVA